MSVVKIAKIQGNLHVPNFDDTIAMLTSVIPDTMQITWKKNSEYQMQFEAYNNGSDAYSMLSPGNMVEKNGQWFVIKHPTVGWSGNLETTSVVATHISSEINRIRIYGDDAPTDFGGYDHAGKSQSVTSVPNNSTETAVSASINDIMQWAFGDQQNRWGITYQIIGSFNSQMIVGPYASGSGKDIISRILAAWSDAVFWPDNLNLRIYAHDEFYKDRGHRLDYLHDTDTVTLEYDPTGMVNAARLVGATQESGGGTGINETETTTQGTGRASEVIADAKKYLGVPYVYGGAGGARGGNPYSGMDCSSFVSQVYKDFGISIPAYTVSMESYGHEISRDQVQTGDMGFYGSHGASHHICMALDNNTMIYEPQPGEVCKTEPISYYSPTWWERNDDMAKIVGGSSQTVDSAEVTNSDSQSTYYFAPFYFVDEASYQRWGPYEGDDITSDTITDKEQMKAYAETQFKPNPDVSLELTAIDWPAIPGDLVRVEIKPANYVTQTGVVGIVSYPDSATNQTTVTLNSNLQTILDYQRGQQAELKSYRDSTKSMIINAQFNSSQAQTTWNETEVKAFDNSKRG